MLKNSGLNLTKMVKTINIMSKGVQITINLTEAEINGLLISAAIKKANKSKGFNISDATLTKCQFKNGDQDTSCLFTSMNVTIKV